jgi:Glycosyltransferase family 87
LRSAAQLALAVLCAAGMWIYVDRVLVQHQKSEALITGTPRGNLSDLYPTWLGARELLLHRRDPYSAEVTREIQAGYYGRPIDVSRPEDPTNEQAFAYPVYVAFLLAPVVKIPFPIVRVIFFWLLLGLTGLSVFLWLRVLKWRVSCIALAMLIVLTLGTFPAVQGIKLQQLSLFVAFLIATAVALLCSERLILAGMLLALAMIKPQLTLLLAGWLMLWAISGWQRRWKLSASFLVCLAVLVGGGELLLHGWLREFYSAVLAYRRYAAGGTLLEQMLPRAIAIPALAVLLASVAAGCWYARKVAVEDERFLYVTSLVLAATLLVPPMYPPHYQLLLLPGVFLLARDAQPTKIVFRFLYVLSAGLMVWSWLLAIVLAGASFFTVRAQQFWAAPLWPTVLFPVPVIACLGWMVFERVPVVLRDRVSE